MMDGSGVVDLDSLHRFHLHLRNRLVSFVLVFDVKNAKVVDVGFDQGVERLEVHNIVWW